MAGSRRQQQMTRAVGGEQVAHRPEVVGVVQDQQPVRGRAEPPPHGRDDHRLVGFIPLRQAQQPRQGDIAGGQRLGRVGAGPEDGRVIFAVPVRILDGRLRLAHPGHADQRRAPPLFQGRAELLEDHISAHEERVLGRDIPPPPRGTATLRGGH
jgi:hypothetical protein